MTTTKITESEIEKFAIELLERQGYQYIYAPDIAPDSTLLNGTGGCAHRTPAKSTAGSTRHPADARKTPGRFCLNFLN